MSAEGSGSALGERPPNAILPSDSRPPPGCPYWQSWEGLKCLLMVATEASNTHRCNAQAADEAALALAADVGGPAALLALAAHGSCEQQEAAAELLARLCSLGGTEFLASLEAANGGPVLLKLLEQQGVCGESAGRALCCLAIHWRSDSTRAALCEAGGAQRLPHLFGSLRSGVVAAAAWLAQLLLCIQRLTASHSFSKPEDTGGQEAVRQLVHLLDWMPGADTALPALAALQHWLQLTLGQSDYSGMAPLWAGTMPHGAANRAAYSADCAEFVVFVKSGGLTVLNDYAWQPGDAAVQQRAASLLRAMAPELHSELYWLQAGQSNDHRRVVTALCHLLPASCQPAQPEDPAKVAQQWASRQAALEAVDAQLQAAGLPTSRLIVCGPKRCNLLRQKYGCKDVQVRQHAAAALVSK